MSELSQYNLEINEKIFSFCGVIGRHAFLLNIVKICALNLLISIPYTTYLLKNYNSFFDFFNNPKMFGGAPFLLKIWLILGTGIISVLFVSNIYRRLNDIFGKENSLRNMLFSAISVIAAFYFIIPLPIGFIFSLASLILTIVLMFKKGEITGVLPYDYKKEFNWGAFFGTWIWGLVNKTYAPLWELLLWITPFGFYFQMYCGLKGNEWAFNNKNCTDVDKFNKSQKNQAIIFTVLNFVIIPVIYFLCVFVLIFAFVFLGYQEGIREGQAQSPEISSNASVDSKLDKFLDGIISNYFGKYEITTDENKFYVLNEDWKNADFKEKKDLLELAASKSALYRKEHNTNKNEYFSKTSELPRTKIYSSETNRLLGEFVIDESKMNGSFTEAFKAALSAYKFYNVNE